MTIRISIVEVKTLNLLTQFNVDTVLEAEVITNYWNAQDGIRAVAWINV